MNILCCNVMYPDMSQHQSHQGLHGNRKNSDLIKSGKSLRESLRRLKSGILFFTKTMFFVNFYFYGGTSLLERVFAEISNFLNSLSPLKWYQFRGYSV